MSTLNVALKIHSSIFYIKIQQNQTLHCYTLNMNQSVQFVLRSYKNDSLKIMITVPNYCNGLGRNWQPMG
jgi:hypothetical protein